MEDGARSPWERRLLEGRKLFDPQAARSMGAKVMENRRLEALWEQLAADPSPAAADRLAQAGADPDELLRAASELGSMELLLACLARAADPRAVDEDGLGAFNGPAQSEAFFDSGRAEALLGQGFDIDARNALGTALCHAAQAGSWGVAKRLLGLGARPDAANDLGETPAMFFAFHADLDAIKGLIQAGADLSLRSLKGASALNIAEIDEKDPKRRAMAEPIRENVILQERDELSRAAAPGRLDPDAEPSRL